MNNISDIEESWTGIVDHVTFHNPENGWTVLKVSPIGEQYAQETVVVYQNKIFAGATLEFKGTWIVDNRYGPQFKASQAIEKKPASAASLEKYLGSGLIKGIGPKTAKKIVKHFKEETLDIFDSTIERLIEVPGIAQKKLLSIESAWREHAAIRDVMLFLQEQGISTLFAVRIYKTYGDESISKVQKNPYCLSDDIYGIGFFSADTVALKLGIAKDSAIRIKAAIKHVLAASRDFGHCYLTQSQILTGVEELIQLNLEDEIHMYLAAMTQNQDMCIRDIEIDNQKIMGFYSKPLYYAEDTIAILLRQMNSVYDLDEDELSAWVQHNCQQHGIQLSDEQTASVVGVARNQVSILTGGPGCGKTTTTQAIVRLFEALGKQVILVAPTGRAAQRMGEVIGRKAKTIHRMLKWQGGRFQINNENPLKTDCLVIDECSMLDISLAASLIKATPSHCQILFIGDADQLPSVGAGNVLKDMIASKAIPCFRLTQIFRQAKTSSIIQFAHQINAGIVPPIRSPFKHPDAWTTGIDCLFVDSDEATQEQLKFIQKATDFLKNAHVILDEHEDPYQFRLNEPIQSAYEAEFTIPERFEHVDLRTIENAQTATEQLKAVLKKVHPWSSLHYNLTAVDVIIQMALHWIPKYLYENIEVQILTPMVRGSLGTVNLNEVMQQHANPPDTEKSQIRVGQKILREGDRVIHRKNNYDLNVYNGDIGRIIRVDLEELTLDVLFMPDNRMVHYKREDMMELDLAYAITIHKSQGSEFGAVIIPVLTQHFKMLHRNLIYTALTRGKKFAAFVGTRRAMAMAVMNQETNKRQTALSSLLQSASGESHSVVHQNEYESV